MPESVNPAVSFPTTWIGPLANTLIPYSAPSAPDPSLQVSTAVLPDTSPDRTAVKSTSAGYGPNPSAAPITRRPRSRTPFAVASIV